MELPPSSTCRSSEKKFPKFAYRYKYKDGEYSVFGPWSEIAFLPESDMIDPVEPAKCIFFLASGKYDNYNGQFLDIRDDLFKNG